MVKKHGGMVEVGNG